MVEIKPTLLRIEPWDTAHGTSIYFNYTGSKQALENELVITDVATKQIVYSFLYSSFEKVHHMPPNELINGKIYQAKIRIRDVEGNYSPYSNIIEFRTFEMPVLDIVSIDGQGYVYNTSITFEASYTQGDGENVRNYRFSLYDENEDLIKNFPVRIPERPNELTETVLDLEKGKGYFIECLIETVNGMVYSHRERFIPMYIVPAINGIISTRNDNKEGFVRITSNLKQIIGTQVKGSSRAGDDSVNYQYINDDWIVVPKEKPILFTGLGMNRASDFIMKVWCQDIPSNTKFLDLSPVDNEGIAIQFWKHDNKVVAVKEFNGKTSRYRSNIVTIPDDAMFMLYAKVIEHRIDLSIQIL